MSFKLSNLRVKSTSAADPFTDQEFDTTTGREAGRPKYQKRARIIGIAIGAVVLCAIIGGGLSALRHKDHNSSDDLSGTTGDGGDNTTTVIRDAAAMALACNYSAPALNITTAQSSAAETTLPTGDFEFTGFLSTVALPGESTSNITAECSPEFLVSTTVNLTDGAYSFGGLNFTPTTSSSNVISFGVSVDVDSDEELTTTATEFYQLLITDGNITTGSLTVVYNSTVLTDDLADQVIDGTFVTCVYLEGLAASQASAANNTEIDVGAVDSGADDDDDDLDDDENDVGDFIGRV